MEHVNSFNPIFRATRRYADLAEKADFLKVVVYNNCGGERYAHFVNNIGSTVFRDVPKQELLQFNNHLLNYTDEATLEDLATAGLSPDYVFRETKRALAGVAGKCRILPGIDIGIPTGARSRKASPEDTYCCNRRCAPCGCRRADLLSQVIRDAIGQPGSRRAGRARSEVGLWMWRVSWQER